MTMTTTESVDTLSPFVGQRSPVLFGIEHEYNLGSGECECGCGDTAYDDDFDDPELPDDWTQGEEHCGWEVRTPPMDDIGAAMDVFRRLSRTFVWGHDDCGYHIHLNADPEMGPAINVAVFAQNWLIHRDTLYRHCPAPGDGVGLVSGERGDYARPIANDVTDWMCDPERYQELNWTSLNAHTTLEVRLAAATADMEAFELWLRYVLAIADMSRLGDNPERDYAGLVKRRSSSWGYLYNAAGTHLLRLGVTAATVTAMSEAITGAS